MTGEFKRKQVKKKTFQKKSLKNAQKINARGKTPENPRKQPLEISPDKR